MKAILQKLSGAVNIHMITFWITLVLSVIFYTVIWFIK